MKSKCDILQQDNLNLVNEASENKIKNKEILDKFLIKTSDSDTKDQHLNHTMNTTFLSNYINKYNEEANKNKVLNNTLNEYKKEIEDNNLRIQEQFETIKLFEAKYNIINEKLYTENSNNCSMDSEIKKLKLELSLDKMNTNLHKNSAFKKMLNKLKIEFDNNYNELHKE